MSSFNHLDVYQILGNEVVQWMPPMTSLVNYKSLIIAYHKSINPNMLHVAEHTFSSLGYGIIDLEKYKAKLF
jgi:hypothetical protein